jgi:hypothetical protein
MKSRSTRHRHSVKPALSSIGLAVVATLFTGGANAAVTGTSVASDQTLGMTNGVATNGDKIIENKLSSTANVAASIQNNQGIINTTGTQTGTSNTVNANAVKSVAVGNTAVGSIDLAVRSTTAVDGLVVHSVSVDNGRITSTVNSNTLAVTLTGLQNGTAANSDNTISAATTVNNTTASIAGVAGAGVASSATGSSIVDYTSTTNTAKKLSVTTGDLVVTTVQQANTGSSATASQDTISIAVRSDGGNPVVSSPLLSGNTISATFKGNSAANTADLQSGAGAAPAYSGSVAVTNLQTQGSPSGSAIAMAADNTSTTISAAVTGAALQGVLSVKDNAKASAATGNEASNAIQLGNGLSFAGNGSPTALTTASYNSGSPDPVKAQVVADLLVLNTQNNFNATVNGTVSGSGISSAVEVLNGAGIDMARNSITASAIGNAATSSVANGVGAVSFSGTAALLNQQSNNTSPIVSTLSSSSIAATAGSVSSGAANKSSVTVEDNLMSSTAFGNQVNQSLVLDALNLTPVGAAVVLDTSAVSASGFATVTNLQSNASSAVTAVGVQSAIGLTANPTSGSTLTGDTLAVARNRQQAVAVGSDASNALALSGNKIGSGAGVLNVQRGDGASSVTAILDAASVNLSAGANVKDSILSVSGNLQRTIGYGTLADNTMSVASTTLELPTATALVASTVTDASAANATVTAAYGVLNKQSILANVTASTTAVSGFSTGGIVAGIPIGIAVNGTLTGSTLSNDTNSLVAAAYGNDASSGLTLALGNVTTPGFVSVGNVTNAQSVVTGAVLASATGGQIIGTQIDSTIDSSSVSTTGNAIQALAVGNRAANEMAVTGVNLSTVALIAIRGSAVSTLGAQTVDASFSVQNVQSSGDTITATQRMASGLASSAGITIGTSASNAVQIANSSVVADQNLSIASATGNSATNILSLAVNTASTTTAVQNVQTASNSVSALIGQVGAGTTANQGGVTLAIAGTNTGITGSTLAVRDNITSGSVTGNAASNSLSVVGTNILPANGRPSSQGIFANSGVQALADHALSNAQVSSALLNSDVYGSFGINLANKANITGSTLSVTGNTQSASAVANTTTNALSLGGTSTVSISGGSSLASQQITNASVQSTSNLDLFSPVGVTNSTVLIMGNTNSALAVANDVTNTATVTATKVASIAGVTNAIATDISGNHSVQGDHVLSNQQSASTSVISTAKTALYNQEAIVTVASLIDSSAVTVSGNATAAEASGNRALNSLSVMAGASQGATAGLFNHQDSSSSITATANTTGTIALGGGAMALNASTVSIAGNSTTALASGNTAANALVMTAGSGYAMSSTAAGSVSGTAQGTATVLNTQNNTAAVAASSTATYQVALNAGGATNGTINVTGNVAAAQVYGNSASNSITLSALNGSTPTAALSNYQTNNGAVTATVSNAYYGSGITGGTTGTAVRVGGNQIVASATGNSVVSSIVASR